MASSVGAAVRPSADTIIQTPCAFNPTGATRKMCESLSILPRHNAKCTAMKCPSRVRFCRVCIVQGGEKKQVINAETGLCSFHTEHGEKTEIPALRQTPLIVRSPPSQNGAAPQTAAKAADPAPPEMPVEQTGLSAERQAALARARKAIAEAKYVEVDPSLIRRNPQQPRKHFDVDELESLRLGIVQDGQLQPGLIRPVPKDKNGTIYEVVDGERRWRAVSRIKGRAYRAFLAELDDDAAAYLMSVALNCNRVEHTHIEISDAIVYMSDVLKMTGEQIAATTGYHPVIVSKYRGLQRIMPEVRDILDPEQSGARRFPFEAAVHISLIKPELQKGYAQKFLKGEISRTGLKHATMDTKVRSNDVVAVRHPDIWEQWRNNAKRAEVVKSRLEELVELIKQTRQPQVIDSPLTGRVAVIAELREINTLVQGAFATLKVKP